MLSEIHHFFLNQNPIAVVVVSTLTLSISFFIYYYINKVLPKDRFIRKIFLRFFAYWLMVASVYLGILGMGLMS